jgi:phosphoserine phosphatase
MSMSSNNNIDNNNNNNNNNSIQSKSFSTMAPPHGQNVETAMHALATADCVCFDVDSTVVNEEGIDVLADYLGQGQAVAALTLQAMEGGMKFQDALRARLDLLKPARPQIEQCLLERPLQLTPGIQELVDKLHAAGKHVYLVSGGFRIMIEPVAEILGIDKSRIVANTILFDDTTGDYLDFDSNEPTSKDMGKPAALLQIQVAGAYKTMVMVGDGATDAQAKPPAAAFIGFGGVAVRKQVQDTADWFVMDFKDMIRIVDESAK